MIPWTITRVKTLYDNIKKLMSKKELEPPIKYDTLNLKKLYYYTGDVKFPFMLLFFNTISQMKTTMRVCKNIYMDNNKILLKYCETSIDIYNKLFSNRNIGNCDKFICEGIEIPFDDVERISKKGPKNKFFKEYEIKWKTIKKLPEGFDTWYSSPYVLSFDIESYSHRHRAFPNKNAYEDIIFSISLIFQTYMRPETRKEYIIILGSTCPIDGVITYTVDNELELLEKFFDIIEDESPDVFIGYNIFGFDFDYINSRLVDVGNEWRNIGRLIDTKCDMISLSWNSSGYGQNK